MNDRDQYVEDDHVHLVPCGDVTEHELTLDCVCGVSEHPRWPIVYHQPLKTTGRVLTCEEGRG